MSNTELKTGISRMLKKVKDERLLKVVYTLIREYSDEPESVLTNEQKREVDHRLELHLKGKSKNYTLGQVKKQAIAKLRK